ncbi:hypothetical protein GGS21DRAFT_519370 [Xylaria nigripes]|nr:hypothetical protein GGS21DRAFT_519370 [Xylaria nigripes]
MALSLPALSLSLLSPFSCYLSLSHLSLSLPFQSLSSFSSRLTNSKVVRPPHVSVSLSFSLWSSLHPHYRRFQSAFGRARLLFVISPTLSLSSSPGLMTTYILILTSGPAVPAVFTGLW